MMKLYDLSQEWYPMLYALRVLTESLSHSDQSAPSCVSDFDAEKWLAMERTLEAIAAQQFVDMALVRDNDEIMEAYFPGWIEDWV